MQWLGSTVLAGMMGVSLLAAPAWSQNQTETPDDEPVRTSAGAEEDTADDSEDTITITGSRIVRSEFSSAAPIQVIDGELSRDLGLVDAADLLSQTTVVQGQQTTTGLSTSAGLITDSGPGSATAGLRGLDSGRTLVLVNGRRLAPAGVRGAPSAPDLNMIPGTLVNRVEILLDGASSVYGSDAVAGVVNYILRDDFDGLQLDAYLTDPEMAGDGGRQQVYTGTLGVSGDRGFIGFAAEYTKTEGFTGREFGSFYEPYAGNCITNYSYGASGEIYEDCGASFGAGVGVFPALGYVGYEAGRQHPGFPDGFFPIPFTLDLLQSGSANGTALLLWPEELNGSQMPDFNRTSLYSIGEFDLGFYGGMTAYFEASYTQRESESTTISQGGLEMPANYALNPFGQAGDIYFLERYTTETDVSQMRLIGGLRGDLPFMDNFGPMHGWSYDAYASFSRSDGFDRVQGLYDYSRYLQVLSNTTVDGSGNASCAPNFAPNSSQVIECRPLDFFDGTFLTTGRFADPEDNDYFFPNRLTRTVVEQSVLSGYATGTLFDLPDGPVGLVLGGEYRKDAIVTDTDAGASGGEFAGFFSDPGSTGDRSLMEAFIEMEAPILMDRPFAEELSVNVAARWTEESNYGASWTYRIQSLYAPNEWLRFRATYGTSFRAPNLGEQFGGRVQFFGNPQDPCRVPGIAIVEVDHDNDPSTPNIRQYDPTLETRSPTVVQNCQNGGGPYNLPGVDPFSLGTTGLGTSNVTFLGASTLVATGSNPDLDAETSEAISAGFVIDQPWFDAFDLRLSATYYDISVDGQVESLSSLAIVALCYDSPNLSNNQCQYITRGGDGEISFVEALNQNLGERVTEGIDVNIEFGMDFTAPVINRPMRYDAIFRATHTLTQFEEETGADGVTINDDLGEYGYPQNRFSLTNVFSIGDWSALWQTRYVGEMIEANDDPFDPVGSGLYACVAAGDTPCNVYENSPEYFVHDASVTWRNDDLVVRAGVNNVFNDAPEPQSNHGYVIRGVGYDLNGRTLFMNVTKRF